MDDNWLLASQGSGDLLLQWISGVDAVALRRHPRGSLLLNGGEASLVMAG